MAWATPWAFGALLAFLPLASHALGLGKLKVHSALNQPLNAEIDFTSLADAELKGLNIGLASRADFTAAGVERAAFLAQIKFAVNRRSDGRYTLHLSTPTAIEEPFLHMLLQLDWPGGRLVREYTALIDPPYQIAAKAPTVEPPRAAAPVPRAEPLAPAPIPEAVVTPPSPIQPPLTETARFMPAEDIPYGPPAIGEVGLSSDGWPLEPGETPPVKPITTKTTAKGRIGPAPSWANVASHTTRRGETLWSITKQVRSDPQVSIEQAALAIYHQNRDAFYDSNLNNIRAGKILRLPAREDVEALSKEQARGAFQAQFDAWQEYKLKLAGAKRTLKADEPAAEQPEKSAGVVEAKPKAATPTTRKETPTAAKGQRSDELLKIVRANLQGEKGADGRKTAEPAKVGAVKEHETLAERAATLEESLVSKQIEQKELGEKINQVRTQLKRESRLIELESQSLAPPPAAKPVEPPKVEAPKIEPPKAEVPKAEAAKAEAPKVEAPKPEDKPKAEAPKPAPKQALPPPPSPEKGFFDTLVGSLGDLFLPIVLGVVVLASAVLGFVYLRRRRQAVAEFEESILASQAVNTENVPTRDTTGEAAATTPESSILSDISQGNLANIHTDEVDPIAEAEVYLAYGRDETAEDILKDAAVKHPQRQELKLKLLEIYSNRKDLKAFETLAEEVYAAVGGKGGKLWEKVEEMGRKLNPENPMFRGVPSGRVTTSAAEKPPVAAAPAVTTPPTEVVSPPPPAESPLDFDLGTPAAAAPTKETSFDLDFDLGDIKPVSPGVASGRAGRGAEEAKIGTMPSPAGSGMGAGLEALDFGAPADNLIDFDLGKTDTGPSQAAAPVGSGAKETKTAASTSEDFSWDIGALTTAEPAATELVPEVAAEPTTGEAQQQQWDEAATKLDLARAYIDMGDADGARSILEEVTAEGNPEQKKQAQELSAQIR
mgnify:CR=1 FL=1